MASFLLLFLAAAVALLISPALSLTCTSQTFSGPNTTFAHCMDLPTLNAFLHWTHDPTATPRPTLSIAFTVAKANPNWWAAWALNPNQSGMLGAQALIAARNGSSYVVKTYSISYTAYAITESNISYNILNMSAEHVNGSTTIFARLELPGTAPVLSQVWQVGPLTPNGAPGMHETKSANLASKGNLTLAGAAAETPAGSPPEVAAAPGPTAGRRGGNSTSGGARRVCGLYGAVLLVLLWASYFGF
ncbi:cytochrome b561 and DOMON domain-containing protein at3g25290 [Phtheirospermum japonicum]|uniref:Cytochrome b561 and DOMON domain-containing protein at3g25290 n=1 Tax=Phtheirospermum japonicum TaxID=374723 RepID=A0A830BRM4_9LAMI|nr:cytochrome b561 and DOMON domain-containing protein at3g25290 [Phtheirospermum japonicum]